MPIPNAIWQLGEIRHYQTYPKHPRLAMIFYNANLQWQGDLNIRDAPRVSKLPYGTFIYRIVQDKWYSNTVDASYSETDAYEVPAGYRTIALLFK